MGRSTLDDLLLTKAIEGLSATEVEELVRLLAAHPGVDESAYERAAAAVCLAGLDIGAPMPPRLRAEVERGAAAFLERAAARR